MMMSMNLWMIAHKHLILPVTAHNHRTIVLHVLLTARNVTECLTTVDMVAHERIVRLMSEHLWVERRKSRSLGSSEGRVMRHVE
jgi:hypothetical protein